MNLDLIIFLSLLIFILLFIIAGSLYVLIYDSIYKKDNDYDEDTK